MSNYETSVPGTSGRPYPEIIQTPALISPSGLSAAGAPAVAQFAPGPEGGEGGAGIARYVHALRRRWLISLVIALPLSAIAAFLTWTLQPQLFTTISLLELAPIDTPLVFTTVDQAHGGPSGTFDTFKKTQKLMVTQRFLLTRALDPDKHPAVLKFAVLKSQQDPVDWLEQHLSVSFPDDSQIMKVALTADESAGLSEIVNSVVEEYYDAVVESEQRRKRDRLGQLRSAYEQASEELRKKRQSLKALAQNVGSADKGALTEVQKNALAQHAAFMQRMVSVNFDRIEASTTLQHRKAAFEEQDPKTLVADADLAAAMANDVAIRQYELERRQILGEIDAMKGRLKPEKSAEKLKAATARLEANAEQLAHRKDELRDDLIEHAKLVITGELDALARQVALLDAQTEQIKAQADKLQAEARKTGQSSIDAEMMSVDIAAYQEIVNNLRVELERTKIESQSNQRPNQEDQNPAARIKILSPAKEVRPVDPKTKLATTIGAGGFSFLLPFLLFVTFDASKNRISTGAEVTQAVGLSVIGAVPILPKRVMRRLNGPSENDKYWRSMLSESVDSIAAVLLKGAQPGTTRVVMVSSANAGEGKTTLAAHLAVSLAGAGRHPVLVDFDLRRPALHRVFGVSLNPGVNEILRDGQDLETCLQATQVPNLMFLSAGRWSKTGLAGLVAADLQALFTQLRAGFDFVIVDACPILPVVDTRIIGQHVDAVLLSVLRDVSRAPKLRAACDLLDMFGIPVIGVVVTGSSEELYQDSRYEPLSEAQAV
jgi:capsular exopolysaccharide synthesis family protein